MRDRHWRQLSEKIALSRGKPMEEIDVEGLTLAKATSEMKLHEEALVAKDLKAKRKFKS